MHLYAPAPVQSGSSVSHWTTDASPNLLMEPVINTGLDRQLHLTLTQLKDIGWKVIDIPFPPSHLRIKNQAVYSNSILIDRDIRDVREADALAIIAARRKLEASGCFTR